MKIIFHGLLVIVFASLSMFGLPASAQTPDGETPANEGVCDELIGLTSGLYGLCVAFCEAQDAEATLDPATGVVTFAEGSKPSNPNLLEIYDKKKAVDDPPMPCVNPQCPCWNEAELDSIGGNYPVDTCLINEGGITFIKGFNSSGDLEFAQIAGGVRQCQYKSVDDSVDPPRTELLRQFVDLEQEGLCFQSVVAECTSRGLPQDP